MVREQQCFVEADSPAPLRDRVAREVRTLASRPWFGLYPVAQRRRWAVRASADTPRELFHALDAVGGKCHVPSDPYLMTRVLETPGDLDAIHRDRDSEHAPMPGVTTGHRLALVLEDWFVLPGTDVLEPQFVTVSVGSAGSKKKEPSHPWIVEVRHVFVFGEGWILRPDGVDITPTEIRPRGDLAPFDIVPALRDDA